MEKEHYFWLFDSISFKLRPYQLRKDINQNQEFDSFFNFNSSFILSELEGLTDAFKVSKDLAFCDKCNSITKVKDVCTKTEEMFGRCFDCNSKINLKKITFDEKLFEITGDFKKC